MMAFPFAESLPLGREGSLVSVPGLPRDQAAPSDVFHSMLAILGGTGTFAETVDIALAETQLPEGFDVLTEDEDHTQGESEETDARFQENLVTLVLQGVPPSMFRPPTDLVVIPRLPHKTYTDSEAIVFVETLHGETGIPLSVEHHTFRFGDAWTATDDAGGEPPPHKPDLDFAGTLGPIPAVELALNPLLPTATYGVTEQSIPHAHQEPQPSQAQTADGISPPPMDGRIYPTGQATSFSITPKTLAFELAVRRADLGSASSTPNPRAFMVPGTSDAEQSPPVADVRIASDGQLRPLTRTQAVEGHFDIPNTTTEPALPKFSDTPPRRAISIAPADARSKDKNPLLPETAISMLPADHKPPSFPPSNIAPALKTSDPPTSDEGTFDRVAHTLSSPESQPQEERQTVSPLTATRSAAGFTLEVARTETATTEDASLDPRDQIASLSDSFETKSSAVQREARDFRIPLEPTGGRPVELRLEQRDGVVQVRVHAAHADTRQTLQQDLSALVSALNEKGVLTHTTKGSTLAGEGPVTDSPGKLQSAGDRIETAVPEVSPGLFEQTTGGADHRGTEQQPTEERDGRQSWQWRENSRRRRSTPWTWADATREVPWLMSQE